LVDAKDFEMLTKWKWCATEAGYAEAYMRGGRAPKLAYMHRLIMLPDPGHEIDHINGDKLDNRRRNLRVCAHGENMRNQRSAFGSSRYKGVSWDNLRGKWRAYIVRDSRQVWLGYFDNEADAARAYNDAAFEVHGEFSLPNVIGALP
jgi:hypothetical protein